MAPMERSPEHLKQRFADVMGSFPAASRRQMFGYPCAFANDQMFTGLYGAGWIVRLPEQERQQLLHDGATPFEPMPGRAMREYVILPPDVIAHQPTLERWLRQAYDYAASLPPKPPRKRPAKKSSA